MPRRLLPVVLVGWGMLFDGASAREPVPLSVAADCPAPGRVLTTREVPLVERQEAVAVPELRLREDVTRGVTTSLELDWREERQVVPGVELRPRQVEQQVTCTTTRPFEEVDPCTGKACIVYKPVPEVKTVKVTVYEAVPVERVVVVRVPVVRAAPREVVVKRLVPEWNTVPAVRKTFEPLFLEHAVPAPPVPPLPPLPCPCDR